MTPRRTVALALGVALPVGMLLGQGFPQWREDPEYQRASEALLSKRRDKALESCLFIWGIRDLIPTPTSCPLGLVATIIVAPPYWALWP